MELVQGHKDPVRNPVQKKMESIFKSNYDKSLKTTKVRIVEILKKR